MKYDIEKLFPCHSVIVGLSGKIGGHVFYMRGRNICARAQVIPSNPRTARQQKGRARFAGAVKAWRALDGEARMEWNRRARKKKRTGYNLFIGEYLRIADERARRASRERAHARVIRYRPGRRPHPMRAAKAARTVPVVAIPIIPIRPRRSRAPDGPRAA